MKHKFLLTAATLLLCATTASFAQGRRIAPAALSTEAREALLFALSSSEGEYAARAEYKAILAKFGSDVQPYANILQAEEQHILALVRQCQRYGVPVPEDTYVDHMTAPATLLDAANAGIAAEKANVAMYDEILEIVTAPASVVQVLTNLRDASLNQHLPAFEAAALNDGALAAGTCNQAACPRQPTGAAGPQRGQGGQPQGLGCLR